MAAEALRKVEVKNNVYFWSSGLTSFWTSWNDTATTAFDSLYTPVFMNSQTAAMFGNSVWPGFVQSGNQNVDPGFGPTINKVLSPGSETTYGVGLLAWIAAVRSGTGTTQSYSYQKTQVGSAANWTPTSQLPESADLKYSSTSVKGASTDGLPLGDPYWFTEKVTELKQFLMCRIPTHYHRTIQTRSTRHSFNYSLEKPSNLSLAIYNVLGQKVATLVNQFMQAGSYSYSFDASRLASGVYFYRIEAGTFVSVKKMLLMK